VFVGEDEKIKNKVLEKYIRVSVVIDMECVDTKNQQIDDLGFLKKSIL
jgi:hypothetical protein